MKKTLSLLCFLAAGCEVEFSGAALDNELPTDDTDLQTVDTTETDVPPDTDPPVDTDPPEPQEWTLVVANETEFDLDLVEVCFDAEREDCTDWGGLTLGGEVAHVQERFDVDQVHVFGFDTSRQQWYTASLTELEVQNGDSYEVELEELACGLYEGNRFYVTFHKSVVYPTTASGAMWDNGFNWDNLDFITGIVDIVVDEYLGDASGDVAAEVADGLGESLEDVTTGTRPPDTVYHLGRYDEYENAVVDEPSDGFPNANYTYHEYDRSERDNPSTRNTIFPIWEDAYTVTIGDGKKLYMNAYDVDDIGSEREGGLSLTHEQLQAMADCGTVNNVVGTELFLSTSVTVQSLPDAD